jgi:NADH dehydrogenase (ubiquinone) Fe-S protein 5
MASGFGYTGGRSRCFTYWQEFQKCYIQSDKPTAECRPLADDYLECLHKPKEIARAKAVQDEFIRKAQETAKEGRKAAEVLAEGTIVGVGLIQRGGPQDPASKH